MNDFISKRDDGAWRPLMIDYLTRGVGFAREIERREGESTARAWFAKHVQLPLHREDASPLAVGDFSLLN